PLNLMSLDHSVQHVLHHQRLFALCYCLSGDVIRSSEDSAKIIRGMAPFCGKPGVVEVQPADHSSDIESCLYRVQLKLGARHFCAVRYYSSRNDRAQKFCTGRIPQGLKTAAQSIKETVAGRVKGFIRFDFVVTNIIGNPDQHCIGVGTDIRYW